MLADEARSKTPILWALSPTSSAGEAKVVPADNPKETVPDSTL
jgi:hypothetical protein